MNNKLPVLNQFGVLAMQYSSEFDKMMVEQGYENPFLRKQQLVQGALQNLNKNLLTDKREWLVKKPLSTDTSETQPQVLTSGLKYISRDDYIKQREEYIIRKLYEKFGMTDGLMDRIKYLKMEHLLSELKPCMAGDKQCTFMCPHYPCEEVNNV